MIFQFAQHTLTDGKDSQSIWRIVINLQLVTTVSDWWWIFMLRKIRRSLSDIIQWSYLPWFNRVLWKLYSSFICRNAGLSMTLVKANYLGYDSEQKTVADLMPTLVFEKSYSRTLYQFIYLTCTHFNPNSVTVLDELSPEWEVMMESIYNNVFHEHQLTSVIFITKCCCSPHIPSLLTLYTICFITSCKITHIHIIVLCQRWDWVVMLRLDLTVVCWMIICWATLMVLVAEPVIHLKQIGQQWEVGYT